MLVKKNKGPFFRPSDPQLLCVFSKGESFEEGERPGWPSIGSVPFIGCGGSFAITSHGDWRVFSGE